jgi:hypothetical protein
MADDNALRQRRKRAHSIGDHELCHPRRCSFRRAMDEELPLAPVGSELEPNVTMTAAVLRALSTLPFGPTDPRFVSATMCVKLAQLFDIQPTASISAEIRRNLVSLLDRPEAAPDYLDAIRARVLVKNTELMIRAAAGRVQNGLLGGSEAETLARLTAWKPEPADA